MMNIKPADRLGSVTTYYFAKKLVEIAELNSKNDRQIINLGIGSPDLLPPEEVLSELKRAADLPDANKYQSYLGLKELRQGFADWYDRFFQVEVSSDENVLPLMGSKEGIMHLHMSLLNPGDEVLVPNPGYPAYRMTAALAGATARFYDLEADKGWLPNFAELEKEDLSKVKIMWINYPHMPTGARADIDFYRDLVQFAKRNNILVCHDNPYAFILNDKPVSIMQVDGALDCCIEMVSLSKCYNMAGWRVGAMIGKKSLLETVLKFKSNMDSGMYKPLQLAATKALSMGQGWMEGLNDIYIKRRKIAYQIMEAVGAQYEEDRAGLFVWAKVNTDKSVATFCDEILYGAQVFITPGHIFGTNGEGYIRISLCSSEAILTEALERILKSKINQQ